MPEDLLTFLFGELSAQRRIKIATTVVVAHPDDEVLGMGGQLRSFECLTLMQLTDGAPRDPCDASNAGCATRGAYAARREGEARSALARLEVNCHRIRCNAEDQEAVHQLSRLRSELERALRESSVVFTHPYEGGHPDHDAAAFLVQNICETIGRSGRTAPLRVEFTSYHCLDGQMVTGRFWPDVRCPELVLQLPPDALARKRDALCRHATQQRVITHFLPDFERYRLAPNYDFSRAPPPGFSLYDSYGWPVTNASWREIVARDLEKSRILA